ncbi:hypothetical protein HDU92_001563 [Lobulomyces angularis]|nr:hypothetical protein HDU92_001563 [Lobulomyces angularis]
MQKNKIDIFDFLYSASNFINNESASGSEINEEFKLRIEQVLTNSLMGEFVLTERTEPLVVPSNRCKYQFKFGEPAYSCSDCGKDNTAAFCANCFKNSNHDGHKTSSEQWKVDICCKLHSNVDTLQEVPVNSLPEQLLCTMKFTISSALDFIIFILNETPFKPCIPFQKSTIFKNDSTLDLIIWFTSTYQPEETINLISLILNCTYKESKKFFDDMRVNGKVRILTSYPCETIFFKAQEFYKNSIVVSLQSTTDVFKENTAGVVISWINNLKKTLANRYVTNITSTLTTNILFNSLQEIIFKSLTSIPNLKNEIFALKDKTLTDTLTSIENSQWTNFFESEFTSKDVLPYFNKKRLDFLFLFYVKLWAKPRKNLIDFFISLILVNSDYEKFFGIRYAFCYLPITHIFMNYDFYSALSLQRGLSYRIFNTASISTYLVTKTPIIQVMATMLKAGSIKLSESNFKLIKCYSLTKNLEKMHLKVQLTDRIAISNERYYRIFQDLIILFSSEAVRAKCRFGSTNSIPYPQGLDLFLDLMFLWNGVAPQKLQAGSHLEEEPDNLISAYKLAGKSQEFRMFFSDCFKKSATTSLNNNELEVDAVKRTILAIKLWTDMDNLDNFSTKSIRELNVSENSFIKVNAFQVSSQAVSMYHPLHWFLADLLTFFLPGSIEKTLPYKQIFQVLCNDEADYDNNILIIMEYPLRTMVFISQIRNGIWVRNGETISTMADVYCNHNLRDGFDADIFLLQLTASLINADKFLATLIVRFEIEDWISEDSTSKSFNTVQTAGIVEDFLQLLITLLTERQRISGLCREVELKREIIHQLAASKKGLSYSELRGKLSPRFNDVKFHLLRYNEAPLEALTHLLPTVADFSAPDGINKLGTYHLKKELFKEIDPWFWHFSRLQRCEVMQQFASLKDNASKISLPLLENLTHELENINALVLSPLFMKILLVTLSKIFKLTSDFEDLKSGFIFLSVTHLIKVGLSISLKKNKEFFFLSLKTFKVNNNLQYISLLQLILQILEIKECSSLKELFLDLRFIIDVFEEENIGLDIILAWKEKQVFSNKRKVSNETENKNKKRKLAQGRKSKVLSQFHQAQHIFKSLDDLNVSVEGDFKKKVPDINKKRDDDKFEIMHFPTGLCVFCQEEADNTTDRYYGMIGNAQPNYLYPVINFGAPNSVFEKIFVDKNLNSSTNNVVGLNFFNKKMDISIFTCGHLIHLDCFKIFEKSRQQSLNVDNSAAFPASFSQARFLFLKKINLIFLFLKSSFMCGMCNATSNIVIPILSIKKSSIIDFSNKNVDINYRNAKFFHASELGDLNSSNFSKGENFKLFLGTLSESKSSSFQIPTELSVSKDFVKSKRFETVVDPFARISTVISMLLGYKNDFSIDYSLFGVDLLWKSYVSTISSMEIRFRDGDACPFEISAVESFTAIISHFNTIEMSLLRVISESILLLSTLICLTGVVEKKFQERAGKLTESLLYGLSKQPTITQNVPLLLRDPFEVLVETSMLLIPLTNTTKAIEILYWVRLIWYVKIFKCVVAIIESIGSFNHDWIKDNRFDSYRVQEMSNDSGSKVFLDWIMLQLHYNCPQRKIVLDNLNISLVIAMCKVICLPFLRKTALLLFTRFGVLPHMKHGEKKFNGEFLALVTFLNLPTVSEVLSENTLNDTILQKILAGWCQEYHSYKISKELLCNFKLNSPVYISENLINIMSPVKFNLIKLPKEHNVLTEHTFKFACKKCIPDPYKKQAICLLCGIIVCFKDVCCSESGEGECNLHSKRHDKYKNMMSLLIFLFLAVEVGLEYFIS